MPLSDVRLRALKPRATVYRVADRDGLCIEIRPTGARLWRLRYRRPHSGRANMLPLGEYPAMGLLEARRMADKERSLLAEGIDPAEARKEAKLRSTLSSATCFRSVALEWLDHRGEFVASTREKALWLLDRYAFPWIGDRPVSSITTLDVLALVRRPEALGKLDTATRLKQRVGQIMRYAIGTGRAERDPTADLRGLLKTAKPTHHAAITDRAGTGALMRSIDGFRGHFVTACALRLTPLVFLRPGELRTLEWVDVDFTDKSIRIPAERMKMPTPHIVPLSRQALAILEELHPLTGSGRLIFPSVRTKARPISNNTITSCLRRLGYTTSDMTAHGFRSMASTLLNEAGFNRDWIERQLAHSERDGVRAAYNYAEWLPERRKMMQAWADLLDQLKAGGTVLEFAAAKA